MFKWKENLGNFIIKVKDESQQFWRKEKGLAYNPKTIWGFLFGLSVKLINFWVAAITLEKFENRISKKITANYNC